MFFILTFPAATLAGEDAASARAVEVFVYLLDVDEIDSVAENFVVNFYAEFHWRDSSLAHPGPDSISRDLEDIWHPRIQILNEERLVRTFPKTAEIRPDGEVIFRQRIWGSLSQPMELRDFPFDSQQLKITLVAVNFGTTGVRFVATPGSGISEQFRLADWAVTGWNFAAADVQIDPALAALPGMEFTLDVKRHTGFFVLKVIIPLLLIVAMSWVVFWLDPAMVAPRISVSVTAMLTLIAYRFAIGGMVPRLSFLTSLDLFVLVSTLLVFMSLVTVVYSTVQSSGGKPERALAIDRKARTLMPLLYLILAIETLYLRIGF